jgi:hypothetical protein
MQVMTAKKGFLFIQGFALGKTCNLRFYISLKARS